MVKREMERLLRRIHRDSIMCQNENGFDVMVIENAFDIDATLHEWFGPFMTPTEPDESEEG